MTTEPESEASLKFDYNGLATWLESSPPGEHVNMA